MSDLVHTLPFGKSTLHVLHDGAPGDWARNVLLLQTVRGNVLIETGNGDDAEPNGFVTERLAALRLKPTDIDLVVLSHADWDHIAGAANRAGDLVFPLARYVLPRAEAEFWRGRPERNRLDAEVDLDFRRLSNVLPVQRLTQIRSRLELVDLPSSPWPGVTLRPCPGHTPGYSIVELEDHGSRLWYIGDMIFDPEGIADPDWVAPYDHDVERVRASRAALLGQAADTNTLLAAYHVAFPGLGTVARKGNGFHWTAKA